MFDPLTPLRPSFTAAYSTTSDKQVTEQMWKQRHVLSDKLTSFSELYKNPSGGPPATFPQWSPFPSLSHKSPAAADWSTSADTPPCLSPTSPETSAYQCYACTTNELLESVWDFNLDIAGRKPSFLNKPAWASLALWTVLSRENRILYNKSNSGCFRMNTRKCFFCKDRLPFCKLNLVQWGKRAVFIHIFWETKVS